MAASLVNDDQTPSNGYRKITDDYTYVYIAFHNHMCDNMISAITDAVMAIGMCTLYRNNFGNNGMQKESRIMLE